MQWRRVTRQTRTLLPKLTLICVAIGCTVWLISGGAGAQGSQPPASPTHAPSAPANGIPLTLSGQTPAYTAQDAQNYVVVHGFPGGNTTTGKPFTVDSVTFVTREQAETMIHGESLTGQVAPGDLVCIVVLSGPFDGSGISAPFGVTVKPADVAQYHGVMVFDAHTGVLLMWGYD